MTDLTTAYHQALEWSPFFQQLARHHQVSQVIQDSHVAIDAQRLEQWFTAITQTPMDTILETETCQQALRRLRQRVLATLMVRDIAQVADVIEVTRTMSDLADLSIRQAYRTVCHRYYDLHGIPRHPTTAKPMEMMILGMGKLGGQELNVSSDIDLIMLYAEEGETDGRRPISNHEFFAKVTRQMMPLLSEQTGQGFVFRTDLRLRPDGDSGPLAWSLEATENYLITQGREWERYAWLKARVIPCQAWNDSHDDSLAFEQLRRPFVYRKYLDFNTLSSLRQLREMIRQDWTRKIQYRSGVHQDDNIKLGRGSIREIEFIVQVQQLIRGGRHANLRIANLLDALQAQTQLGIVSPEKAQRLRQAYLFLRRVEHFLQYKEDSQTHILPQSESELRILANIMGYSLTDFTAQLALHREFVEEEFHQVFHHDNEITPTNIADEGALQQLAREQITNDSEQVEPLLQAFFLNSRIRSLPDASRQRLFHILSSVFQHTNDAHILKYFLNILEKIAPRSAYLALLDEYPDTITRLIALMQKSPWVANFLTHNPILLDSVIDWHLLMRPLDFAEIQHDLRKQLNTAVLPNGRADVEQQMNIMRDLQKQLRFQLLAQDLDGQLTVEHLADELSAIADICLQEILSHIWTELRQTRFPDAPEQAQFAIIAYGRLGGKELGYQSDLDLVMLYDDPRPEAIEQYTLLARRLCTWCTTMTSSGRLYDIDLRLRPDGDAGLLVVSKAAFDRYQQEKAWVWEHQALTRARFVAGDQILGEAFEQTRRQILSQVRDLPALRQAILEMREKMIQGHPNHTNLFDLKHDRGGMVDIEFIVQYLVLAYSHQYPDLMQNLGNINLLKIAAQHQLIPLELAIACGDLYRLYRATQHHCRLQGQEKARIDPQQIQPQAVFELWELVFHTE